MNVVNIMVHWNKITTKRLPLIRAPASENIGYVRPAKIQISLRIHAIQSESALGAFWIANITKTHLYNFDPLKPPFYNVKLDFTGVYIISLISAQKHRLWVFVRTASNAVLTSTYNLCFEQKYVSENFQFFCGEIFNIFE